MQRSPGKAVGGAHQSALEVWLNHIEVMSQFSETVLCRTLLNIFVESFWCSVLTTRFFSGRKS